MSETTILDLELNEIVDRLVRGLDPEQIFLFGSYSKETQIVGESDIDLLVVLPTSNLPRYQREEQSYDLLWGLTKAVDLVVLTSKEFSFAAEVKTSLPHYVEKEGILIYESG